MRVWDLHVHSGFGDEKKAGDYLKALDEAKYEGAVVLSPMIDWDEKSATAENQRKSIETVMKIASADKDRIIPFATIAPQVKGAPDGVAYAKEKGCRGLKMLPNHWYPYDEKILFPVYKAAQEAELPILFHSGILWGYGDSSRFCRPVFFEALIHFPKVRFALAHIGWPWTDECIATWGRMNAHSRHSAAPPQMYIDCTPGTPRFYRTEAMERAVKYCSCDWLIFGTDGHVGPGSGGMRGHFIRDNDILAGEIGVSESDREKYFSGNLFKFLGGK